MSGELFGAMAMFYAVTSGAGGGGSSLTPPAAIIGAAPQLNFSDVANTGGYLQNSAAAGTIVTDGAYFDGASWIPKDTGAVMLQMNGALAGFVMYVNTSLTPGTPFTPTMVYQYLGAGSNVDFAPPVGATGGVVVSGGSLPTTGDSLSITKTNIAAKNWGAGTYNAVAMQASGFTFQTGTSSITSSLAFDQFGSLTQTHVAQSGAAENLYTGSIADDATAKFQIKNGSSTDGVFVSNLKTIGSSTNFAFRQDITIATDSGTNPCWSINFDIGGANIATRPLLKISSVGADLLQLLPLGTGNNACLSWVASGGGAPAFTTRSVGSALVLYNAIGAAAVDCAIGSRSSGGVLWCSVPVSNTSNIFEWYAGTTKIGRWFGDGTLDLALGGLLVRGATVNAAGPGMEILHNGTAGSINSYDRSGATWKALGVQALSMSFTCNTVLQLSLDATRTSFSGGIAYKTTVVTGAGPTTIAGTDDWLVANPTVTAAATYNLPAAPATGEEHTITDEKLIAAANNITISGNGKNITNGTTATTEVIATNGGSRTLRYNGTNWNIIAKV